MDLSSIGFCSVAHALAKWTLNATNLATDDANAGLTHDTTPTANSADIDTLVESIGGSRIVVPTDATILGVSIVVKFKSTTPGGTLPLHVQLRGSAGLLGDQKTEAGSTTVKTATLGSSTDLWGATLTPTVVNHADFGVRISTTLAGAVGVFLIYYLEITIHYSVPVFVTRNPVAKSYHEVVHPATESFHRAEAPMAESFWRVVHAWAEKG